MASQPTAKAPNEGEVFDWEDLNVYQWTFYDATPSTAEVIFYLLGGLIFFPMLLYAALWLVGLISSILSFVISILLLLILLLALSTVVWGSFHGGAFAKKKATSESYWVTIALTGVFIYATSSPVSPVFGGFSGNTNSSLQWLLFFSDNALQVLTLDVVDILDLRLSSITPQTWSARSAIAIFKLLITFGLVEAALTIYGSLRQRIFYGSVKECFLECDDVPHDNDTSVKCTGKVERFTEPFKEMPTRDFIACFKDRAGKEG